MKIVERKEIDGTTSLWHLCPACRQPHRVVTGPGTGARWTFDGNHAVPTFAPSVRCRWSGENNDGSKYEEICHYFIRGGQIEYCGDCTHGLAGQTVPLPEFPPDHWIFQSQSS